MMAMRMEGERSNVLRDVKENLYTPKPAGRRNSGASRTFQRQPLQIRSDVGDT